MTTIAMAVRSILSPPSGGVIPKLLLGEDHDQFAPAALLAQGAVSAAEPKRMVLLPGADHFFEGQLEAMLRARSGWLKEQLP
jgi:hypothetical protein